jgi:hypothetical protein
MRPLLAYALLDVRCTGQSSLTSIHATKPRFGSFAPHLLGHAPRTYHDFTAETRLPEVLDEIEKRGGKRKAVIFTESVRTQHTWPAC